MNRRGFIKGLGALLATSALVRPPPFLTETVTSTVTDGAWIADDLFIKIIDQNLWHDLMAAAERELLITGQCVIEGPVGQWDGITFRTVPVSRISVDETFPHETKALDADSRINNSYESSRCGVPSEDETPR